MDYPDNKLKPTVILGLGNTLMSDEGIGVRIAQKLMEDGNIPDHVEVLDLGSGGLRALHIIKDRKKAVFIDCAYMNEEPGTMRRFTPEEVRTTKIETRLSMHESDLIRTIELSQELGECPDEVVIFGIQPEVVEPGEELSSRLQDNLSIYIERVKKESL